MIYYEESKILIPKHYKDSPIELILINNLTNQEFKFTELEDLSDNSFYYEFAINLDALDTGEYTYKFGKEIGLLTVGNYSPIIKEYQTNNTRIQYERKS